MHTKSEIVKKLLQNKNTKHLPQEKADAFAPANIALCKYWGKRDATLNLPVTSSLSISLGKKGTTTHLEISDTPHDVIMLNDKEMDFASEFSQRIIAFLNLIPERSTCFQIKTYSNIPIAAGLASSASGFAALTLALNQLYQWRLTPSELSVLARLGSGSACRSIWPGFVEWNAGVDPEGMDSVGEPLLDVWPELCIGLSIISEKKKWISSREAMQRTVDTSPFYSAWPTKVDNDLRVLKQAIKNKDFTLLGKTSESNAMAMHATMMSAWPPIIYSLPETISMMKTLWELRHQGLDLYFTQDAGPNLKLLFLQKDQAIVQKYFPSVEIIDPYKKY